MKRILLCVCALFGVAYSVDGAQRDRVVASQVGSAGAFVSTREETRSSLTQRLGRSGSSEWNALHFRGASAGTSWVRVHPPGTSPCDEFDPLSEFTWCFEGAGGDSTWPAGPGGTSRRAHWDHYPRFAPPGSSPVASGGVSTYDNWHLELDPMYKNKGTFCTFSDDWMWAIRPPGGAFENGFEMMLVTPALPLDGFRGAVVRYDEYECGPEFGAFHRFDNLVRFYETTTQAWGTWNTIDFAVFPPSCAWSKSRIDLSDLITETSDSVQVAWEIINTALDGTNGWGNHQSLQWLVDNVSFGRYDPNSTQYSLSIVSDFVDTFSVTDPSHTSSLENDELNDWIGIGGSRVFEQGDSLAVVITDRDGITAPDSGGPGNVAIYWRHDDGGPNFGGGAFGAWMSKDMKLRTQIPTSTSNEGTYTTILGNDTTEDAHLPNGNGLIWKAGTTVQYYIRVVDNASNVSTLPEDISSPLDFRILPTGNATPTGHSILVVDDYRRELLDYEESFGFDPTVGPGNGSFERPELTPEVDRVLDALDLLYGLDPDDTELSEIVDLYRVGGAGTGAQSEPNGIAIESGPTTLVGGYMTAGGTPAYDAIIWLHGTFDEDTYLDETRLELMTFLDSGGQLISAGDGIATHLGSGGSNADSTLAFMNDYLGTTLPVDTDIATEDRQLSVAGEGGTEYDGYGLGLYGDCPVIRSFDRLTLTPSPASGSTARVLMAYADGGASDTGRHAVIENVRTASGGRAIHSGFGLSAMQSRNAIACYLDVALHDIVGLTDPAYPCPSPVDHGTGLGEPPDDFSQFLAAATPNPFVGETSIRFQVPTPQHVSVEVYNVLGQKVRTLVNEVLEATGHARTWDGRTDGGERVSSGIYFVRMRAESFSATRRVVLRK